MSSVALNAIAYFTALAAMEGVAWFTHKYVMHGFLWSWHQSHHRPRVGHFEKNDLFAVVFATPAILFMYIGTLGSHWNNLEWFWAGLGVASYGLVYAVFHDILVHRRINHNYLPNSSYMRRIVHAHRLHHVITTKEDGVSFGFIVTASPLQIRARMKVLEAARANS